MNGTRIVFAAIGILAAYSASSAAPVRKPVIARRSSAPAKSAVKSPTAALVEALVFNGTKGDENLATACRLANAKALLWALDGVLKDWNDSKGEFETTEAFDARIAKLSDALNGDRTTIVCLPLADESTSAKYDADKQSFQVSDYAFERIGSYSKDTGSYLSSTAMGAKARVYRSYGVDYKVDLGEGNSDPLARFGCAKERYLYSQFAVPASEAQPVKAGGYLVLKGKLVSPYYTRTTHRSEPTLSDPYDTETLSLSLRLEPLGAVIVGPTGQQYSCALAKPQ